MPNFTPGPVFYTCKKCGWSGEVNATPRCLACSLAAVKRWKAANPDRHKQHKTASERRCRVANPGKEAAHKRRVRGNNPEHYKAKWAERSAWLKSGDVTKDQLKNLFESAGGLCYLCGCVVKAPRFSPTDPRGVDHVLARVNGGLHTISNLAVCCGECNARKAGS